MSNKPSTAAAAASAFNPLDYADSPVHYAVALGDHHALSKLLSSLPKLPDPTRFQSESDSIAQERLAEQLSAVLDGRQNRLRETPLHLAVRLNDATSTRVLAAAGANASLQNAAGWNPLQEAILSRRPDIVSTLVQHHHLAAWSKWRRRLPRLVGALHRMRDFYMEISFHFESSIVPLVGKIAPSDTYRIWKRDGNLRADTSLAGFDGLKIQRSNQSFIFLNGLDDNYGTLLILKHDERKIYDAFEGAGSPLSEFDVSNFCNQMSVYRPGMDVTKAELISRTNWRRQEKTENVGDWKARVYDMHNVTVTFRSRKVNADDNSRFEIGQDFIVAENPRPLSEVHRRHSSFVREETEFVTVSRKSVDINFIPRRTGAVALPLPQTKEKEYAKSLRPTVWLTDGFPLKTEELLPLLDILVNKVKAVRRMRELLTTTFPAGAFPAKVAIPVVPTVRVVITFTKFVELPPAEESFYTPLSSPRQFEVEAISDSSSYLSSSSSGMRRSSGMRSGGSGRDLVAGDPFAIPGGYSWGSLDGKNGKQKKKSKCTRRTQ